MLSTPGAADCAAYCVYWENKYASNYFQIAATTLFFCDYLATLSQELRCIWGREVSLTSLLFLMNRYATLCNNALGLLQSTSWAAREQYLSLETLIALFRLGDVCAILEYLVLSVFAALRTYALWNKNRRIFISVLGLGLVYPVSYVYVSIQRSFNAARHSSATCEYYQTLPQIQTAKFGDNVTLFALSIGSSMVFECLTIALTWMRTVSLIRQAKQMSTTSNAPSLSLVICYDGTLHFTALLLMNTIGLLGFVWRPLFYAASTSLSDTLTSILVSRFILDLREAYAARGSGPSSGQGASFYIFDLTSIRFASEVNGDTPELDNVNTAMTSVKKAHDV